MHSKAKESVFHGCSFHAVALFLIGRFAPRLLFFFLLHDRVFRGIETECLPFTTDKAEQSTRG